MTDLTGQTIGQYQLIELIHRGENTVYKGFQPSMNRYVAVKVLNPALAANPAFVQAFPQNMQRITALQHPNILPIYDYGQQGELFYIISQYIESGTLQDRLPPAFSPQQAQAMLNPIVDALDQAYPLGVGYGNIKPSNILINAQGRPLLADLGYIQGIDTGGVENIYLSPEQRQGAAPDPRSDVYALGILLYHMLVGEPPLTGAVASVRTRRPDLPEAIERVILTATAQAPEQRFQNPDQLRAAFNQALPPPATAAPPQAVPQPPASPPASTQKSKQGGCNWLIILVGGLLAACCLLGVLGVFFVDSDRDTAAPTPPPDVEQPVPEPTPPPDGSLLQGLFDMIAGIFDRLADIIDDILGGGSPPPEPTPEPPGEQPPPEEPPPAEQLPAEPEESPAGEAGEAGAE